MWLLSSRGKRFNAVFTFLLWMLRYRSRRKISARCLLFASKPCGTGVEKDFQKVRNRMSFFALHVAVREWRDQANTGSRYEQTGRSEKYFMKFQNKCRFGGSKVAVGWWEEILREIGSVLAPDSRGHRELAPFWRQKTKTKEVFSRVASFLMPSPKAKSDYGINFDAIEKFFSEALYFSRSHDLPPEGAFKKFSRAPIKTSLLIPYLVKGTENFLPDGLIFRSFRDLPLEGRVFSGDTHKTDPSHSSLSEGIYRKMAITRKYFLQALIFHRSRDLPLEREKVFSGTPKNTHLKLLASEGVPQEHPIPSLEKEVISNRQLNNRHRNRYDLATI